MDEHIKEGSRHLASRLSLADGWGQCKAPWGIKQCGCFSQGNFPQHKWLQETQLQCFVTKEGQLYAENGRVTQPLLHNKNC